MSDPFLSKTIPFYLTWGRDLAGLDVTVGGSFVGALRIRVDRRNAIGKLSLVFDSSSSGVWLRSLFWLVCSFFFISCISSSVSVLCLRFLPLVGVFISWILSSFFGVFISWILSSSFFGVFDTVRRFFLFQFFDFRRRCFFDGVFICLSSWLLFISCAITFGFVSSDETIRERWELDDSWSDWTSFFIGGGERDFLGVRFTFFSVLIGA